MATSKKTSKKQTSGATTTQTSAKKNGQTKSGKTKSGKKPSSAQHCWPGYEPTPGKAAGEKGSCKPKAKQTKTEKKGDQKAAAASKLSGQR